MIPDTDYSTQFQTPPDVASYMASLVPEGCSRVLEPTPGSGNIVAALTRAGIPQVIAPDDFFRIDQTERFDCIVMNPPFSGKYTFGSPAGDEYKGMRAGYAILKACLKMSDHVIALMPWFTIIDSDVRLRFLKKYGMISVTALPRSTFKYVRIQTCIFQLRRGYDQDTRFLLFETRNIHPQLFTT